MKRICLLLLLLLPLGAVSQAARWEVYRTTADGITWSIDRASLRRTGGRASIWLRLDYPDGSWGTNLVFLQYCLGGTAIAKERLWDPEGARVYHYDFPENALCWTPVREGTVLADLYREFEIPCPI